MLEYIYCYIYIQVYKQPRQEGDVTAVSADPTGVHTEGDARHQVCSQIKAKDKSQIFF